MSVLFAGVCGCDGVFLSLLSAYCEKFLHDKRLCLRKICYFLVIFVCLCCFGCGGYLPMCLPVRIMCAFCCGMFYGQTFSA